MENSLGVQITKRLASLATERDQHVDVWRRCYQYTYPLRASGFFGETLSAQDGLTKQGELNDSTATESVRVLVSHMMEGMTPSSALWFGLDVGEESDEEKRWLAAAAKIIWSNITVSNFDSVAFEGLIDAVCAGWFALYIDEANGGGYHFEQWPLAECYVSSSRPSAPIDTIYRKFKLTAIQAVTEYGADAVSDDIRKAIEDGKESERFEFIHAIYPRKNYAVNARMAKNMPFASVHVECKTKNVLKESGYHEFPVVVPRWMLLPGSQYAVGPVFEALPDAATVNKVKEFDLINMDMAVGGLWIAEDDGVLNPRSIKIGPRRVIVANSVDSMKPLQPATNFNVAFMQEDRIQSQIRKLLLADILPPLEGMPKTAAEIHMRMGYIRQMMGPVFARLQSEYLQPLVERCFGIAYRAGILGRPPQSLGNRTFRVKYESPLARAQKLSEVSAIDDYVMGLVNLAATTGDMSVMDNVDVDKAARYRADALGVPADLVPSVDDMNEKRQARQQAMQQAQQEQIGANVQQEAGIAAAKRMVGGK